MQSEDYKCAPDEGEGVDRGQLVRDIPTMMDGGGGQGCHHHCREGWRVGDTHSERLGFNQRAAGSHSRSLHSGEYNN